MKNRIISTAKAAWYYAYESARLRYERMLHAKEYGSRDEPLISVYCPTYNRKELLMERAVKSVLEQTYENFEFIVIADGCTDGTVDALIQVGDDRIRYYTTERTERRYPPTADNHWFAGPVVAANSGLKEAGGKWIARIDDDDIWTDNHLEILLSMASMLKVEFISSAYKTPDGTIHPNKNTHEQGGHSSWFYRSYLKFFKYNIDCWRKSNNRVNDLDMAERMRLAGVKMAYFPFSTYSIEPRPGETEIGSKAYLNNPEVMDKYRFEG